MRDWHPIAVVLFWLVIGPLMLVAAFIPAPWHSGYGSPFVIFANRAAPGSSQEKP